MLERDFDFAHTEPVIGVHLFEPTGNLHTTFHPASPGRACNSRRAERYAACQGFAYRRRAAKTAPGFSMRPMPLTFGTGLFETFPYPLLIDVV